MKRDLKALQQRRLKAARLLAKGVPQAEVARRVGATRQSVSRWAVKLVERRGKHKAVVAVANKMARIIWSMLYHQTDYNPA